MIIDVVNDDVLNTSYKHVVFAISTDGISKSGFVKKACHYAFGLQNRKRCKIGEILNIIPIYNIKFHGIVCYSPENGWNDAPKIITKCLDKIRTIKDDFIAVVLVESGFVGHMYDSEVIPIIKAIHLSKKKCVIYSYMYKKKAILSVINRK